MLSLPRSSGVLLHPTSLPGGRLGDEARAFVDWLAEAGQSWWQLLPLGPPDDQGSPYKAASAFACWPGLLADPEASVSAEEIEDFVARHAYWIGEWAAHATGWQSLPPALRRNPSSSSSARRAGGWAAHPAGGAIAAQVRFEREWTALREYARERGVRLIGDLPIYVADGAADHRSHPELFQEGVVAGVPPDAFSRTGQLWGNPLYDWATMRATGYRWWIERFRRTSELVDLTRVDHFRGFVSYWAVRATARTARRGAWRRGPGRLLFDAVKAELGELPVIAEDLGVITPPVERLRHDLGFPGMRVLQFAYDGDPHNPHLPEHHPEHAVVYTGTHDNDTALGWARTTGALAGPEPHWQLIELALGSLARVAIVPAQDVLGLGSEARLNTPGRPEGNWTWRLEPGQLTSGHAGRLREATEASRRLGSGCGTSRAASARRPRR